jgi:hypothetical protein
MATTPSQRVLVSVCVLLVAVTAGVAMYAGRLHWQNGFLQAELARAREKARAAPEPATRETRGEWRTLTQEERQAMLVELDNEVGSVRDVWFVRAANDGEAAAYQRAFQDLFEEAGWTVRASVEATFRLRPGIFFLMADSEPPSYVEHARAAFEAASVEISAGRGYRAFHEEKRASDPNWRGIDMAPDQAYTIAVGRKPPE